MTLAEKLNQSLRCYFSDPSNEAYRAQLVWAAYYVHHDVLNKIKLKPRTSSVIFVEGCEFATDGTIAKDGHPIRAEVMAKLDIPQADEYLGDIEALLGTGLLESIKISEKKSIELERLIRSLRKSSDIRVNQAFDVLNLAFYRYFKSGFISSHHDAIATQLFSLQQVLNVLDKNSPSTITIQIVSEGLKSVVDYHFSLSDEERKQNYPKLTATVNDVFAEAKNIIENDIRLKTIWYNLQAALVGLGVFYGLYLIATLQNRDTFFLQPEGCLMLSEATERIAVLKDSVEIELQDEPADQTPLL